MKKVSIMIRLISLIYCLGISSSFADEVPKAIQGTYSSCNYKIVQGGSEKASLGDELTVKVERLDNVVQQAAKTNKKITLYLNGMALKGVNPA